MCLEPCAVVRQSSKSAACDKIDRWLQKRGPISGNIRRSLVYWSNTPGMNMYVCVHPCVYEMSECVWVHVNNADIACYEILTTVTNIFAMTNSAWSLHPSKRSVYKRCILLSCVICLRFIVVSRKQCLCKSCRWLTLRDFI